MTTAVVAQCFIKLDTLQGLLESLLKCDGHRDVDLIFWHDVVAGNRREAEYRAAGEAVGGFIRDFAERSAGEFRSIEVHENSRNLGCYKTCQLAMDHAFGKHERVIFAEDDVIFSRDAISWFTEVFDLGLLDHEQVWAVAGQSIFFDARDKIAGPELVGAAAAAARQQRLAYKYTMHDFVPSACFATSRARWSAFGGTRGQPNGDVAVCHRCKAERRFCVFPVVPRAKDVGMLHELGYSVSIHTQEGIRAITQPYLMAEDVLPEAAVGRLGLTRYDGDAGLLFRQSTQLQGFAPVLPPSAALAVAASLPGGQPAAGLAVSAPPVELGAAETETMDANIEPHITSLETAGNSGFVPVLKEALARAIRGEAKLTPEVRDIAGMSGQKYRSLINTLVELVERPRYLEIGVWRGSTFCSAIYQNKVDALAIDNWAEFGGPANQFLSNLSRFKGQDSHVSFLERDFRQVDFSAIGKFNIYFFDGPHQPKDQRDGIVLVQPALDDEFILIVDDWNWSWVRDGTLQGIREAGLNVSYSVEIRTSLDDSQPKWHGAQSDWHNGYFLAACLKRQENRAGLVLASE